MNAISVVTVTHNSSFILGDFLDRLLDDREINDEIFIVDSGSSDIDIVRLIAQGYGVDLIERAENVGFGLGTNIGVRSARNDWIAIVNPDVKVTLGQLKELCAIAAAANIACLGPQVIDQAGCVVSTARSTIRPPWRGSGFRPTVSGDLTFCESISGCCMVMRREEFERVGGFDRYFFMFAEEIDLHSRITSDGGKVAVTRQVTVQTPGGGSSSSVSKRWNATEREVAHVRYVRKHFGMVDASVDFVWRVLRILGGGVYVPRLDSLRQLWRGVSDSTRSMR